jgi:hypothetical protein
MARTLVNAINHSELLYRGLGMSLIAIALHNFFWLFIGTFIMFGIAQLYDEPQVTSLATTAPRAPPPPLTRIALRKSTTAASPSSGPPPSSPPAATSTAASPSPPTA